MREIKLKKLILDRFRGQSVEIDISDAETLIYGRNKAGKSTLLNAWCYVLTGSDMEDRASNGCELFDRNYDYSAQDNPITSVSVLIELNGYDYELRRTAQKSYSRQRSTGLYVKNDSDTYKNYIDGVERSAKEYKEWIETNIAPIDKLKIMVNIYHFLSIDEWKIQRKLLADIAGEVHKEDFTNDYSVLYAELQKHPSIDVLKEKVKHNSKPLWEQLGKGTSKGSLVTEIETMVANLPDLSLVNEAEKRISDNKAKLADLEKEISDKQESVSPQMKQREAELAEIEEQKTALRNAKSEYDADTYKYIEDKKKEVRELKAKYSELEAQYNAGLVSDEERKLKIEIANIAVKNEEIYILNQKTKKAFDNDAIMLDESKQKLASLNKKIIELRGKRDEIKSRVFTPNNCAYCGQSLPDHKLENLREEFNDKREADLAIIVRDGKATNVEITNLSEVIENLQSKVDAGYKVIADQCDATLKAKLLNLQSSEKKPFADTIEAIDLRNKISHITEVDMISQPLFEETAEYSELISNIDVLQANLTIVPKIDISELTFQQKGLNSSIAQDNRIIGLRDEYDRQVKKIEVKKSERKNISAELAKWEQLGNLIKDYEREYADIVKNRVNSLFERVTVEMTRLSKGEDIIDACEIYYNGIPSKVFNFAELALSGIDVATAFMKHFDIMLPIWIDNYESINEDSLQELSDYQVVKMIVSDSDYKLRIETK